MPGKAPAFPLHVRDFSKSQNMIPRRGTLKKNYISIVAQDIGAVNLFYTIYGMQ